MSYARSIASVILIIFVCATYGFPQEQAVASNTKPEHHVTQVERDCLADPVISKLQRSFPIWCPAANSEVTLEARYPMLRRLSATRHATAPGVLFMACASSPARRTSPTSLPTPPA